MLCETMYSLLKLWHIMTTAFLFMRPATSHCSRVPQLNFAGYHIKRVTEQHQKHIQEKVYLRSYCFLLYEGRSSSSSQLCLGLHVALKETDNSSGNTSSGHKWQFKCLCHLEVVYTSGVGTIMQKLWGCLLNSI